MTGNLSLKNQNNLSSTEGAVRGAFILTLSAMILKVLGLIYKIPLSRLLGDEGMGYFNAAYTVYSLIYVVCSAGVPKALTMLVTEAKDKENVSYAEKILKKSLSAFFRVGLVFSLLFAAFCVPVSNLIGNSKSYYSMLAVAPAIVFSALSGVLRGYLTAEIKLGSVALSQIIDGAGKLAFGLAFAYRGYELGWSSELISAFTIFGVTVGSFLSFVYLYLVRISSKQKEITEQSCSNSADSKIIKRVLSISVPITLSAIIMSGAGIIDLFLIIRRLIVAGYSEAEATALYGNYTTLAIPMFNLVVALVSPISVSFLPSFTKFLTRGDFNSAQSVLKSAMNLSAFLSMPMVIGLIVFSREILTMIFPYSNVDAGAPLLCLLMPGALVMALLIIVNSMLEATGCVKVPLISMSVGFIFKLLIGIFLLSRSEFGIAAAPIGTVISYTVSLVISTATLSQKKNINAPILSTHIIPLLNSIISVLISKRLYYILPGTMNLSLRVLASVAVCALIYGIFCLLSGVFRTFKMQNLAKCTNYT